MASIKKSVGTGGVNDAADVKTVVSLLRRHKQWVAIASALPTDGSYTTAVGDAVAAFQESAGAILKPDGRADPGGFTMKRLNMAKIEAPRHAVFAPQCWTRTGAGLAQANFKAAATALGCETAAVQAVAEVEVSARGAWEDVSGLPIILFERHYFRDRTGGAYNLTHPDISDAPGGYGLYSKQYPKLKRAAMLDEAAALKSASWGSFQIMGANHVLAGYPTVERFVSTKNESQDKHLDAFVSFIDGTPKAKTAIQQKNWANFAAAYNGPGYAKNAYDTKMAAAYKKFSTATKPAKKTP